MDGHFLGIGQAVVQAPLYHSLTKSWFLVFSGFCLYHAVHSVFLALYLWKLLVQAWYRVVQGGTGGGAFLVWYTRKSALVQGGTGKTSHI